MEARVLDAIGDGHQNPTDWKGSPDTPEAVDGP